MVRTATSTAPVGPEVAVEESGGAVAMSVHGGKVLLADVMTALGSLLVLAILQNTDVIVLGRRMHEHSGAYAAISVPSKALVFVALVLVNYLLPEATLRHQRGSHALRQLAHTLGVMAIPCAVLLAMAVLAPRRVLALVFGHRLTAAAPAFSSLVLAMVFMSVTVALAIYLLGHRVAVGGAGPGGGGRRPGRPPPTRPVGSTWQPPGPTSPYRWACASS